MICDQLQIHWMMCQAMRHDADPQLRQHGVVYFTSKKVCTLRPLEHKAVGFVNDLPKARKMVKK